MNIYEAIFIINPNIPDDETAAIIKKMQDVVAKEGGTLENTDDWGKKKLAYEVNKHKRGHYVLFRIKSEPSVVKELERVLKLSDNVVRYLIVKLVKELRKPVPKKPGKGQQAGASSAEAPAAAAGA